MSFAFFFPGQGSQSLNMMSGLEEIDCVKATFNEASSILGEDLWAMITGTDEALIDVTVNTQPIMLTAGIASWRIYLGTKGKMPQVMAGHSLGEYTALVASGCMDFAQAIKLVRLRGQLMQQAVPAGEGSMAAILGLDDETVISVCAEAAQGDIVSAANFNAKGQVVIAGQTAAVERAITAAKEAGAKRALPLPVSVPSHCALMKGAAEKLADALAEVEIKTPSIRVLHNADVKSYSEPAQIKDYAWFSQNAVSQTRPVGQLKPNAWGLYDMHGNVWEWCQDVYHQDFYGRSRQIVSNPLSSDGGWSRVLRGGSWNCEPVFIRSAYRYSYDHAFRHSSIGFRLARTIDAQASS